MFNILSYQRNASQNALHLTPVRMTKIKTTGDSTCWRGCGARGGLQHCCWEGRLVQSLWKSIWQFLRKVRIILPQVLAILLDIYPKDTPSYHKNICSTMFIAAVFIIARNWKQPRHSQIEEYRKRGTFYTMEYY